MKKRIFSTLLCIAIMLTILLPLASTANAYTEDCGTIYLQKGLAFNRRLKDVAFNYTGSYLPRVIGEIPGMSVTFKQSNTAHNIYEFTLKGTPTQAGTYQFTCALQKDTDTNNYPTVTACTYTVVVMDNSPKAVSHTAFYNESYSYELIDKVNPYTGAEVEGLDGTGLSLQQENGKWFIKGTLEKLGTIKYTARLLYEGNAYREFAVTLKSTYPNFSSSVKAKTGESFTHAIEITNTHYAGYKSFTQTSGSLLDGVKISDSMEGLRVSGTPTVPGSYVVKFNLKFYDGTTATHTLTIQVECGQHEPEDVWYSDEGTHWRFCTLCDKGIDMGSHVGGQATCDTRAKCDVCGEFYGSFGEHDSYGYPKAATDSNYHTHHDITCNQCHVTLYEEEHYFGPLTERNTRYCIVCWYETEPEGSDHVCSGGYATCVSPAVCDTCGDPYGDPNPENHDVYGYCKAENDSKYHTHHDITCDLCHVTLYEEEHYFGPLTERDTHYCIICWYETEPINVDTNIKFNHTLNLASDISINFVIAKSLLAGYDMENAYVEFRFDVYSGNEVTGSDAIQVAPVLNGNYYYFTFNGLNATMMNNDVQAIFYGTKDGVIYKSNVDIYSVATYAYSQLNKTGISVALQTLCADLLRYGSTAQTFKNYRTDALANSAMTAAHKTYLSDDTAVTFDSYNSTGAEIANPTVTWVGKSLLLDSKVTLRYIVDLSKYMGNIEDLALLVNYTDSDGDKHSMYLHNIAVYDASKNWYSFDFNGLLAAELRQPVTVAVYKGSTRISGTLTYSASTYGNNKTGALLTLCKHLMAYSDSAKAYFQS